MVEQELATFKRVDRCVEAPVAACWFAVPWLNLGEKWAVETNEGVLYARRHGTGNAWLLARYEYQSKRRGPKMSCKQWNVHSGCVGVQEGLLRPER